MIALVDLAALNKVLARLDCVCCIDDTCIEVQSDCSAVRNSIPLATLGHNFAMAGRLWVAEAERDLVNGGWVELRVSH